MEQAAAEARVRVHNFHGRDTRLQSLDDVGKKDDALDLGALIFDAMHSAPVCTYDSDRPDRPFHLYEALAPHTDAGTVTAAEAIVAKTIAEAVNLYERGVRSGQADRDHYRELVEGAAL